jgi:hypothetical protein
LDLFSGSEGYSDWLSNDNDPVSTLIDSDIDSEYTSNAEYQDELAVGLGTPQSEYAILDGMRMSFGEEDEEKILQLGASLDSPDNFSATRNPNTCCDDSDNSGLGTTATSPSKNFARKRNSYNTTTTTLKGKRKYSEVVSSACTDAHANATSTIHFGVDRLLASDNNSSSKRKAPAAEAVLPYAGGERSEESNMEENHYDLEHDRAKFKPHSIKASIFQVLEEVGAAGLQVSQIVDITQERGMKDWRGVLTPKCTVSASCSTDPVFVRVAPGTFALRALLDKASIPIPSVGARKRKRIRTSYKQYAKYC